MPNTPPRHDPNRPKPQGTAPEGTPKERRAEQSDDARQEERLRRQTTKDGGLGQDAPGGYADQVPATSEGSRSPSTRAGTRR